MKIGVRGHDVSCTDAQDLCDKLKKIGVENVQLALLKSFPSMEFTRQSIRNTADVFKKNGIHISVLSCYIDPLTPQGEEIFNRFLSFASEFQADVVATETAVRVSKELETEKNYQLLFDVAKRFDIVAKKHNVKFAFEAVTGMPLHSVTVMKRLCADLNSENFGLIVDPANLINSENIEMQQEIFSEVFDKCANKIIAIHHKANPKIDMHQAFNFAKNRPEVTVITEGLCDAILLQELHKMRGSQ